MVNFDEKGAVTRYRVLSDDELHNSENSGLLTAEKHLPEFQQPASGITIKTASVAGKDSLEISGACLKTVYTPRLCAGAKYLIAAEQIEGLSSVGWNRSSAEPPLTSVFEVVVHLKERIGREGSTTGRGKDWSDKMFGLHTDVPTVVLLINFLHRPITK